MFQIIPGEIQHIFSFDKYIDILRCAPFSNSDGIRSYHKARTCNIRINLIKLIRMSIRTNVIQIISGRSYLEWPVWIGIPYIKVIR